MEKIPIIKRMGHGNKEISKGKSKYVLINCIVTFLDATIIKLAFSILLR